MEIKNADTSAALDWLRTLIVLMLIVGILLVLAGVFCLLDWRLAMIVDGVLLVLLAVLAMHVTKD